MKSFFRFTIAFFSLVIVLSSCSSSNDVVSNGLIQKRKYQKGFHLDFIKKHQKPIDAYVKAESKPESKKSEEFTENENDAEFLDYTSTDSNRQSVELKPERRITREAVKAMAPASIKQHISELKKIMPVNPKDGIEPDKESPKSNTAGVSLVLALLAWTFAIFSVIISFTGIPFVPFLLLLAGLVAAIVAVSLASKNRKENEVAQAAFILGWVYLSLAILSMLILAFFLALVILILMSAG